MTFEKYSHIIYNLVRRHWAIVDFHATAKAFSTMRGRIDGKIMLLDDSYIDFSEEISIVAKLVTKVHYRYEFVKDKMEVFRYDNFERHPGIRPPYHHKHISKRRVVQLKVAPKLINIIEE
jgi:hypothetical protein